MRKYLLNVLLELESSDKELLIPRMTIEQLDFAFGQDAPLGLVIFNFDTNYVQYFIDEIDLASK